MNINKKIKHGDIYGFGIEKIDYLRSISINTYADIDEISDIELYRLPGFGRTVIHNLKDYVQSLKDADKLTEKELDEIPKTGDLKYFAGLAMQGILAAGIVTKTNEVAADAIAYAEELVFQLNN